jgi:hypothetical protein
VKSWLSAATMQGGVTVTILSGRYRITFLAAKYCSNEPCTIVFAMSDENDNIMFFLVTVSAL